MTTNDMRARAVVALVAHRTVNTSRLSVDRSRAIEFEYGDTGANRADEVVDLNGAIAASTTLTFDFIGVVERFTGDVIDLTRLQLLRVQNTGTTTLTLGGTCQIVAAIKLRPGGVYMVVDGGATGYTNSGGTGAGTVTITNDSASVVGAYSLQAVGVNT